MSRFGPVDMVKKSAGAAIEFNQEVSQAQTKEEVGQAAQRLVGKTIGAAAIATGLEGLNMGGLAGEIVKNFKKGIV